MSIEFAAIAGGVLRATLPKVAAAMASAVKHKLNPTDLQQAIAHGSKYHTAIAKCLLFSQLGFSLVLLDRSLT